MRCGRALAAVVVLFASVIGLDAQERQQNGLGAKRVWEWTAEERLAKRFEPVAAAARRVAAMQEGRDINDPRANVIVGSRNPELFLPSELMDLLSPAFDSDAGVRAKKRDETDRRVKSLGLPPDFWERLEDVAQPFFAANSNLRRLNLELRSATTDFAREQQIHSELFRINASLCRERADALASARKEFGPLVFDRFLYQTIAPDASVIVTSSGGSGADSLLWVEEGCR